MKKILFGFILVLLLYAFFESAAATALFCLARFGNMRYAPADKLSAEQAATIRSFIDTSVSYFEFDAEAGWTIQKNGRYQDIYRANSAGIRADREYDFDIPDGTVRIATFGDSFTHCDDVGNDETWQFFMESERPDFEVLNFGVGAYGLDQAYVRYKNKGRRYDTDFVLIGFMPENIYRMVNTFRAFYQADTGLPLSKPRFVLEDDGIVLMPNPLPTLAHYQELLDNPEDKFPEMGAHDYFYHQRYVSGPFDWSPAVRMIKMMIERFRVRFSDKEPILKGVFNERSEAFAVTTKVFDLFYRACQEHAIPVIVVFPHRGNMDQAHRYNIREYAPLLDYFESKGYRYIDLMDAFAVELRRGNIADLFAGLHYSARGNRLAASYIFKYLDGCAMPQGRAAPAHRPSVPAGTTARSGASH